MDVMPEAMRWLSGEKPHVKEGKEKAGGAWYVIVWSCDSSPECLPPDFPYGRKKFLRETEKHGRKLREHNDKLKRMAIFA